MGGTNKKADAEVAAPSRRKRKLNVTDEQSRIDESLFKVAERNSVDDNNNETGSKSDDDVSIPEVRKQKKSRYSAAFVECSKPANGVADLYDDKIIDLIPKARVAFARSPRSYGRAGRLPLPPEELIFDPRLDINNPECPFVTDSEWRTQQQKVGLEDYLKLSPKQRRQKILAYFAYNRERCKSAGAAVPDDENFRVSGYRETGNYFHQQLGWPVSTVQNMRSLLVTGVNRNKNAVHLDRPDGQKTKAHVEAEKLIASIHQQLAEVGGEVDKLPVSIYSQIKNSKIDSNYVSALIKLDPVIFPQIERMRQAREIHLEAKRSLIIAKYIDYSGDHRDRRNACVRYFWQTPGFDQTTVLKACDQFVRRGSVWSLPKLSDTNWNAEEMKFDNENRSKILQLTRSEIEYVNDMNALQAELKLTLNKNRKNAPTGPAELRGLKLVDDAEESSVGAASKHANSGDAEKQQLQQALITERARSALLERQLAEALQLLQFNNSQQ